MHVQHLILMSFAKLSAGTLRYVAQATAYNNELCETRITTAIYRVLMLNS